MSQNFSVLFFLILPLAVFAVNMCKTQAAYLDRLRVLYCVTYQISHPNVVHTFHDGFCFHITFSQRLLILLRSYN